MKKFFLFAAILLLPFFSPAQSGITFEISDKLHDAKFISKLQSAVVSPDGQNVYVLRNTASLIKGTHRIQVLGADLTLKGENDVKTEKKKGLMEFLRPGNNTFLTMFEYNKAQNNITVYAQQFDDKKVAGTGEKIELLTMPDMKIGNSVFFRYFLDNNESLFQYSPDSSKILLVTSRINKRRQDDEYFLGVFNENMEKIWRKKIMLPFPKKDFSVEDYYVSSNGDAYVVGRKKSKKKSHAKFNELYLLKYNAGEKEQKYNILFDKEKLRLSEISILEKKEGGIRILGFVYNKKAFLKTDLVEGLLLVDLDKDMNEVKRAYKDLDFKHYVFESGNKQKEKPKKKKDNAEQQSFLKFRKRVDLADGSSLIIGEQYRLIIHTYSSMGYGMGGGMMHTTYSYHYGNLIAIKFSAAGDVEWAKLIPKRQVSGGTFALGTAFMLQNNKMHLLFNDDVRNLDDTREHLFRYSDDYKKGVFAVVTLDVNTGETNKKAIFNLKDKEIRTAPQQHYQVDDNQLIIFGSRGKNDRIIKLTFK